ncbi:hypothetical protein ANO11243_079650 [Dothideomycetidae sp. 11243]|nr:hypothetical protein ANO11243_079650 [fungal sp. No.11243]
MQGFNMGRYYPPPESDSGPAQVFNKTHPLGQRARKLRSEGILTVRFEMPFAIWCGTCPKPTIIGQGVRFNAEKKKVGAYHSTPVWQFRMKHAACGGWIEIRTDPKATEYVVIEGAKRRDYGEERSDDGEEVLDPEEKERRREDAMAGLEGKKDDEKDKKEAGQRVNELLEESDRWWRDPYEASRFVRKGFRRDRKERVRETRIAEELKDRMGLDIELLPESETDKLKARLVEFGDWSEGGARAAVSKPLFEEVPAKKTTTKATDMRTRSERHKAQTKESFEDKVRHNTRAAVDPFARTQTTTHAPLPGIRAALGGIKKPTTSTPLEDSLPPADTEKTPQAPTSLVAYDSD